MSSSLIITDPNKQLTAQPDVNRLVLTSPPERFEIPVASVREAIHWAGQTGFAQGRKIIIVLQAQRLNSISQQALLKVLEEPTADTQIILVVDQLSTLLPTIRSRCAVISVNQLNDQELTELGIGRGATQEPFEPSISWQQLRQSEADRWPLLETLAKSKDAQRVVAHLEAWQDEVYQEIQRANNSQLNLLAKQAQLIDECLQAAHRHVLTRLVLSRLVTRLEDICSQ